MVREQALRGHRHRRQLQGKEQRQHRLLTRGSNVPALRNTTSARRFGTTTVREWRQKFIPAINTGVTWPSRRGKATANKKAPFSRTPRPLDTPTPADSLTSMRLALIPNRPGIVEHAHDVITICDGPIRQPVSAKRIQDRTYSSRAAECYRRGQSAQTEALDRKSRRRSQSLPRTVPGLSNCTSGGRRGGCTPNLMPGAWWPRAGCNLRPTPECCRRIPAQR